MGLLNKNLPQNTATGPVQPVVRSAIDRTGLEEEGKRLFAEAERASSSWNIAKETIKGIPGALKEVLFPARGYKEEELAKAQPSLIQGIKAVPQVGTEIGVGIGGLLSKVPGITGVTEKIAQTKIGGKLTEAGAKIQEKLEEFAKPKTVEEAKAMRLVDIVSSIPMGTMKSLSGSVRAISKLDDVVRIERELVTAGIPKIISKELAPTLTKITDELEISNRINEALKAKKVPVEGGLLARASKTPSLSETLGKSTDVENELRVAEDLRAKTEEARVFGRTLPEQKTMEARANIRKKLAEEARGGALSKEAEPLVQEARKYKTVEEFIKGQGTPVYRGGEAGFAPSDRGAFKDSGFSVARDIKTAKEYGKVSEGFISPNAKIKQLGQVMEDIDSKIAQAKKEGFDAVEFSSYDRSGKITNEVLVLNKDVVQTRSQLTTAFNEAKGATTKAPATAKPVSSLPKKPLSEVDRLIAENKIRVVSRNGRDAYEYRSPIGWKQAPNESIAVERATAEPKILEKKRPVQVFLSESLEMEKARLELKRETLENNPVKALARFAAKTGEEKGVLKEVTGKGKTIFGKRGDDIVTELGFEDSESARLAYADYSADIAQFREEEAFLKEKVTEYKAQMRAREIPPTKMPEPAVKRALKAEIVQITGTGEARTLEKAAQEQAAIARGEVDMAVPSIPTMVQQVQTPVNRKVNMLDYIRTPDRILKKLGLEKEGDLVRKGYDAYIKELPKNIERITEWSKRVSNEGNIRIFKWLDGQAVDLLPVERKVANEIKIWLSIWADRLGLPKDDRIAEYITHIFDDQLIAKEFDEDLAKIIADKIPGSVYNPFLEKRLGAKGYVQDTWRALDAYVKRATRKVHMDPALEKLEMASTGLEKSQWDYIKQYVDRVNMRPTDLDNLLDNGVKQMIGYRLGQRPTLMVTRLLRQMTYRGMLGLNVGSALRNISQGVNTYAKLGEKYTTIGYSKLFSPANHAELAREGILSAGFIEDRAISTTKKAVQKMDKGLFAFFDAAERINRGAAYFGAKSKALAEGKNELEAIEFAKKIVRDTQFVFGSIDTPLVLSSDLAKTLAQFQTYTTKQIEFLTEMAQNKEFIGLARYAIAGLAFVYTIGRTFGMEPKELIPMYRLGTPPSLKFPVETVKALMNAPDKYGHPRSIEKKLSDVTDTLWGVLPGGVQLKKTIGGATSVLEGGVYDKGGRLQFQQGGTTAEQAQSLIFGKYASTQAKDYFSGMTAAEQLDAEYAKLPPEEARKKFAELKEKNESLAEGVARAAQDRKLGVTEDEKKMRSLGVANGDRAYAVDEAIMALPEEDRKEYYADLRKKKVITDDVAEQLKKIRTGEKVGRGRKASLFKLIKEELAPKVAEASMVQVQAKDLGLVAVPKKWSHAMNDVYERYPDLPQGIIEAVLMMESSMGKDISNKKFNYGEYGYLGGHTKTGAFKDLLEMASKDPKIEKKIRILEKEGEVYKIANIKNLGDEYAAVQATGSVLARLIRNNPEIPLEDLYFKKYVTEKSSDTKERRRKFNTAFGFYSGTNI